MIIKIDGVTTAQQAKQIREFGGCLMGINAENKNGIKPALEMLNHKTDDCYFKTKYYDPKDMKQCSNLTLKTIKELLKYNIDNIDIWYFNFLETHTSIDYLKNLENYSFILADIDAAADSEAWWIFDPKTEAYLEENLDITLQLDLYADYGENAWESFRDISPQWTNSMMQISEIQEFTEKYNVIADLECKPETICEILETFPNLKGIAFDLRTKYENKSLEYILEIAQRIKDFKS